MIELIMMIEMIMNMMKIFNNDDLIEMMMMNEMCGGAVEHHRGELETLTELTEPI